MLNRLSRLTSFANAIRITAALTLLLLLVSNSIIKIQHRRADSDKRPSIRLIFGDSPYMVSIASYVRISLFSWNSVTFDKEHFVLALVYFFLVRGNFMASLKLTLVVFYLQLYAVEKGVNESLAFYAVRCENFAPSLSTNQHLRLHF